MAFLEGMPARPDPFGVCGMREAVDRIMRARDSVERVAIYGDYDADGVTAAAILVEALGGLGLEPIVHIPHRFEEGYGVNPQGLEKLADAGVELVITVDCGIRSVAEVALARDLGMDVIITDHHEPGDVLPPALVIVDPKVDVEPPGFREYSGAGVAYLLAHALVLASDRPEPEDLLDLVAIGTVSDLVPLVDANRSLVRRGLEQLRTTRRPGLRALIEVAGMQGKALTASSIGFGLGPRLNAVGRLASAEKAFALLVTRNDDEARSLAEELDRTNRERQDLTREMVERARAQVLENGGDAPILFAGGKDFNEGVVGLAAGRLMEEFYRPCVVASIGPQVTRASVRSIPEFHITQALDQCAEWMIRYGGHAAAAGFCVENSNLALVLERLSEVARAYFGDAAPEARMRLDAEVLLGDVDEDLMAFVERLEPCGFGNPPPLMAARSVRVVSARQVGSGGVHLKMMVQDGTGTQEAIAFRMGHLIPRVNSQVDLAFQLERNEYMGVRSLQMNVRDLRAA